MKKISKEELQQILKAHRLWLGSDGHRGNRAELSEIDFSGEDLAEVNLGMADLAGANLSGANLLLADLSQADLFGADLSNSDLSGADLLLADFIEANMTGADLSVSDLSGANLTRADLSSAMLPQADLSGANLSNADLSGADLSGANLAGADLSKANLTQTRLLKANLSGADLSGANLLLAPTYSADFTGANLDGVMIDSLTLSQLPTEISQKFRHKFQLIDLDRSAELTTVREIEFPPLYYQAGLSILSYFASILAQNYSSNDLRIRLEIKGLIISLVLEASNMEIKNKVEDELEIYGLVVQGKMVPDALSHDKKKIRRLANQLIHARNLVNSERQLYGANPLDKDTVETDVRWLRESVGRLLQHPETRIKEERHFVRTPIIQVSTGPQLFQGVIKGLMEKQSALRPELLVLFQKSTLKSLDEMDIDEIEVCLSSIRKKMPKVFEEIAEAFYDCGMSQGRSLWGNAFLNAVNKH